MPEDGYTIPETCIRLKTSYGRVYNAILSGKVNAKKVGAGYMISDSDLPLLAEVLGLPPPAKPPAPRRRRAA